MTEEESKLELLLEKVELKKEREKADKFRGEVGNKIDSLEKSIKEIVFNTDISSVINEIKNIKLEQPKVNVIVPEIKSPEVVVSIPEIKIPKIEVPPIKVNVPEAKVTVNLPEEMAIKEPYWLSKVIEPLLSAIKGIVISAPKMTLPSKATEAIPVRLSNGKKFYEILSNIGTQVGGAIDTSSLATSANQTNGDQLVKIKETSPLDSSKLNASLLLSKNAAGELVYLDKTFDSTTVRKTFTRSDMIVATTEAISAFV